MIQLGHLHNPLDNVLPLVEFLLGLRVGFGELDADGGEDHVGVCQAARGETRKKVE